MTDKETAARFCKQHFLIKNIYPNEININSNVIAEMHVFNCLNSKILFRFCDACRMAWATGCQWYQCMIQTYTSGIKL